MNATYQKTSPFNEFGDCPTDLGEYVVRGTFMESSEARTFDYPGTYELGVIEAEYTYINQTENLK